MKILVTGGAGFIGSNFIRYWLENHPLDSILNLDCLAYAGHLSSTRDFASSSQYQFVKGNILNAKLLGQVLPGMDAVVHFAAETHVDRSVLGPAVFVRTNVLGTQTLLDAVLRHKIPRFHHISTDEVFGALPLDSTAKFNENTPYHPHSPYSASKAASDHLVRSYVDTFGLPATITNCSNNFGPFQDPEKFIPRMITHLLGGKKVPVYGDGLYVRDWLYVKDHCRAIEAVLLHGQIGETYCVGGQEEAISNLEVTKKVLRLLDQPESMVEFVKDRPGHDRRYAVDWSKIHRELGWSPQYDFDAWLSKTVEWYKNNQWWWQPLKAKSEKIYAK